MAAMVTSSRGAPYRGVGAPYRRNAHQGELPTSRSSDQINLHRRGHTEKHDVSTSYTYGGGTTKAQRTSVGANHTGRFNRSVWTKASTSSWTSTAAGGASNTTNTSTTTPRRTSLPRIKLTDSVAAVAHSGAVGAYIRKTLAARRSQSLITCPQRVSSPDNSDPGGGGGGGSDRSHVGGERSHVATERSHVGETEDRQLGGGRLEALPSYHKSPNAAAPPLAQRAMGPYHQSLGQQGRRERQAATGGGPGGTSHTGGYYNTEQDLAPGVEDHQQVSGGNAGTLTSSTITSGTGRLPGESGGFRGEESEGYHYHGGHLMSDDNSTLMVSAPPPHHQQHSSQYLSPIPSTSTTSSSSSSPSGYQTLKHGSNKRNKALPWNKDGNQRNAPLPWNKHNQQLLQEGHKGVHHLSPLHTGSKHTGTGSSLTPAQRMAATRGSMQHMAGGDNRGIGHGNNTNFPMIEFRSYTKEPGATQHRTFTFNLPPEGSIVSNNPGGGGGGVFPPGFPSSVSSISPTSVGTATDSGTSSSLLAFSHRLSIDNGDEDYDFRNRKGSISNELAPGFRKLLRTSTPKREREPQEISKRRKVEFRVESPEVLDVASKDPVTAISEKLELNRSPLMGELLTDDGEKRSKKPPKSILKKREKGAHGTGEVKLAKKYQAILVQQGSFKLPSITDGQHLSLTGRNTKANSGRNTNFSCSREFAAAFETIDNGDL